MSRQRRPFTDDPGRYVTLFADASWCPDTYAMGWAGWVKYGSPAKTIKVHGRSVSNDSNAAELTALRKTAHHAISSNVPLDDKIVVIQSDCTGALSKFDEAIFYNLGARYVKKKHVKGHSGTGNPRSAVNHWCDRQAYAEMSAVRETVKCNG